MAQQTINTSAGNDDTMLKVWTKGNANFDELYEASGSIAPHIDTRYPTSDDDITQGFVPGNFWINESHPGTGLICIDNTEGAARWTNGVIGVKEENVAPMRKGSVLMIIRQQGSKTEVGLVDPTNPLRFRGMAVAAEDISQNGNGFMLPHGEITLDTRPSVGGINADAVSWVAGDDLYATADATGRWSKVRPAFGRIIRVGKCISDSSITGSVYVHVKENIIRNMCAATESAFVQLGDDAGGTGWILQNYNGDAVAGIDSEGNATFNSVVGSTASWSTTFTEATPVANTLTVAHTLSRVPASVTLLDPDGYMFTAKTKPTSTQIIVEFGVALDAGTYTILAI